MILSKPGIELRVFGCAVLLITLALLSLTACGSKPQVARLVEANQLAENTSITISGSSSILITERSDDTLNRIEEVRIFPFSIVADPSDSIDLSAIAFDARGQRMADLDFVWAMVDPRAGTITEDGKFVAGLVPGLYDDAVSVTSIQNTPDGIQYISETASVNVVGELAVSKLTSVAILPEKPTVLSGQIFRLRAVGFDQSGLLIPGVSFTWQVNDPALGHVNDLGFLTVEAAEGKYNGALTVSGVWEGILLTSTTDVTVIATPEKDNFLSVQILPKSFQLDQEDRLQLRAIALNGLGQLESSAEFRWSMDDERAGTISSTGIFFAGTEAGIFTESIKVEAVVFGQDGIARAEDFASVVVRGEKQERRLESIRVIPQSIVAERGGRAILTTQGIDEFGKPVSGVTTSWEAVQQDVGSIVDNGQFIGSRVPGSYPDSLRVTVKQPLDDDIVIKSKSVDVTITGTLSRVEIKPSLATITPGRTLHFTATGFDENGNQLNGLITRWKVSDESIGRIDGFGNFTAGESAGHYEGAIMAEVIQRQPTVR